MERARIEAVDAHTEAVGADRPFIVVKIEPLCVFLAVAFGVYSAFGKDTVNIGKVAFRAGERVKAPFQPFGEELMGFGLGMETEP